MRECLRVCVCCAYNAQSPGRRVSRLCAIQIVRRLLALIARNNSKQHQVHFPAAGRIEQILILYSLAHLTPLLIKFHHDCCAYAYSVDRALARPSSCNCCLVCTIVAAAIGRVVETSEQYRGKFTSIGREVSALIEEEREAPK